MNITLRQLSVFAAVARHRSFTRAAEELNLTQPAVSMQVKQLEEQLQTPLFEQIGKKLYLTEAGDEVFRSARAVAQQIDDLATTLDTLKGLEAGRLRLSAISTANYFVPRLLGVFHAHHPGVAVSLDSTNREAVLAKLADNETDLGVMGQPPEDADLEAEAFMNNPLVIVAPPDHPLAAETSVPLARLEEEAFLLREPGSGTRGAMERYFKAHGLDLRQGMEIRSLEGLKQSVRAGLGLALLPRDAVEMELALERLVILKVEDFPIMRHWYLVHRKAKKLSPPAQAFKEFVLAEAESLLHGRG